MKKILVADDDPGIQDVFKIILERAGYDVEVISNGQEVLNNRYRIPHLFILDKQLSGVDGLDICKFLKAQRKTAGIPVIMVSANPQIGRLSKEAGADGYIEKPFEMKNFLKLVEKYLNGI
jgi:DNA-binding response OmpR family regulator